MVGAASWDTIIHLDQLPAAPSTVFAARSYVPVMVAQNIPFWTDLHDWDGHNSYHTDFLAASSIVLSAERLGYDAARVCEPLAEQGSSS